MQSIDNYPTDDKDHKNLSNLNDINRDRNKEQRFRSLELSLISNQRMNAVMSKMKTGELSMSNTKFSNGYFNNSQKEEKIFEGPFPNSNVLNSNQYTSGLNSTEQQDFQ